MAEVQYKSEPTVSVHGVPQSQYNQQMGGDQGQGGGGISGHFRQHWVAYTLGIGAAGLVLMYLIYRSQNSSGSTAATTGNSSTGSTTAPPSIDSSWGSQLDADYQQLISVQTQNTGLLQSILNGITGANNPTQGTSGGGTSGTGTGSGSGTGTGGSGGGGVTPPPIPNPFTPLMGNTPIAHPMLGEQFSFEGILFQLVPGKQNRIYGVQEQQGHPYSSQQLINAPLGFGTGQKRLLTTGG